MEDVRVSHSVKHTHNKTFFWGSYFLDSILRYHGVKFSCFLLLKIKIKSGDCHEAQSLRVRTFFTFWLSFSGRNWVWAEVKVGVRSWPFTEALVCWVFLTFKQLGILSNQNTFFKCTSVGVFVALWKQASKMKRTCWEREIERECHSVSGCGALKQSL